MLKVECNCIWERPKLSQKKKKAAGGVFGTLGIQDEVINVR